VLQNERQAEILKRIKENQSVRIGDLTALFQVTRETVRRDLYELEKMGSIKKVHGGAVLNKAGDEPPYSVRSILRVESKQLIAKKAASFVEDGDTLFIDLGTTTLLFARELAAKRNITVITNSLPVAIALSGNESARIILCGGELRGGDLSLSGTVASKTMKDFYVDKSFIGVGGISPEHGITDYHVDEAEIRRMMMGRAKENYALCDFSKFNVVAFTKVCELRDVDTVVVDKALPDKELAHFKEHGVQVIVAD